MAGEQETILDVLEAFEMALVSAEVRVITNPAEAPVASSVPTALVLLSDIEFDESFGGETDKHTLTVRVFAGRYSERTSIARLYELMGRGAGSIKTLLEDDADLNSNWGVRVVRAGNVSIRQFGETDFLAADLTVEVYC
jgi:hypothetical protein